MLILWKGAEIFVDACVDVLSVLTACPIMRLLCVCVGREKKAGLFSLVLTEGIFVNYNSYNHNFIITFNTIINIYLFCMHMTMI